MRMGKRSSVRVLGWAGLALVMLGAVSVTAVALTSSHGKVPPSKPLAVALHDAATAAPPAGVTAHFAVHQHLIPGSSHAALLGAAGRRHRHRLGSRQHGAPVAALAAGLHPAGV